MSQALSHPTMTQAEFLAWEPPDDRRYEFDGFVAVAMTGGTNNHNLICQNIWAALRARLRGTPCQSLGPDAGVETIGAAVRYPDALVTCTRLRGEARLVQNPVVIFEVVSPGSDRTDHVEKLREYRAVSTIRRYVLVQQRGAGLTVLERAAGAFDWTASSLLAEDTLHMPEIGIAIPVAEFYEGIVFPKDGRWPPDSEDYPED